MKNHFLKPHLANILIILLIYQDHRLFWRAHFFKQEANEFCVNEIVLCRFSTFSSVFFLWTHTRVVLFSIILECPVFGPFLSALSHIRSKKTLPTKMYVHKTLDLFSQPRNMILYFFIYLSYVSIYFRNLIVLL